MDGEYRDFEEIIPEFSLNKHIEFNDIVVATKEIVIY